MRLLSLLFMLSLFFVACEGTSSTDTAAETEEPEVEAAVMKYTLTPFSESQQFADAAIESMDYQGGKFAFGVGGETYNLGVQTPDADAKMCANSAKGQHIHLIIDNSPYIAKYEAEFEQEVADGEHYLLAFLSRSYHESIKTETANTAKKVTVEGGNIKASEDITDPMLFYSRPKGTYVGEKDTKKVMLDFYVKNLKLGSDYKVKASINGEEHMIDAWQPYYIEGMPMGENTIELTLVDGSGNTVDTPLNPVSRTFTLKAAPDEATN